MLGSSLGTEARAGSILTSPSALLKVAGTILFYYRFYSKFFSLGECYFTFQPTSIVSVLLVCLTKPSGHHLFIFFFSRCQLHALHLSHSTDPVSPRGGLLHMSGAPAFMSGALVCGTVTRGHLQINWFWWLSGFMLTGPAGQ